MPNEILQHEGLNIQLRPNTSDYKAIEECLIKKGYERRYFKIESGETWLDAGANIGAFSLLCHLRGATAIAYEPEPNNANLAQMNLQNNQSKTIVHQAAIVADTYQDKQIAFWLHHTDYGQWRHTTIRRNRKQKLLTVPAIRISDAIQHVDCVKLDIEGAEIEILESIPNWQGIKKLVFEYHFDTDNLVSRYRNIVAQLESQFDNVKAPSIKAGIEHYTWFPPAKVVFCWNNPK